MRAAAILCLVVAVAVHGRFVPHQKLMRRGMTNVPLVINGDDVDVGEWPWQCAMMVDLGSLFFNCGCSILDNTHILTAGHCLDGWSPSDVVFIVGAHDLYTQKEGNPTEVSVRHIHIHPDYDFDPFGVPKRDVSVAITEEIVFDYYIQAVPDIAPSGAGDMFVDQECYITGWGDTSKIFLQHLIDKGHSLGIIKMPLAQEHLVQILRRAKFTPYSICRSCSVLLTAAGGSVLPDVMQEARIRVLELADCQERYSSTPYRVYEDSICIFKMEDSDDHTASCYGDSGGPLVCRESSAADWIQAGLTSWGYPPCGVDGSKDGLPSVYMATGFKEIREFIDDVLAE